MKPLKNGARIQARELYIIYREKIMKMTFNEFYELLEASTRGSANRIAPYMLHFKPYVEDAERNPLPAGHPQINEEVFSINTSFLRQNSFKITYPFHPSAPEKTDLEGLREKFEERNWEDFVSYAPDVEARRQFGGSI